MAFTFLKAEGFNIGTSLLDEESLDFCTEMLKKHSDKIILPVDVAVTTEYSETEEYKVKDINTAVNKVTTDFNEYKTNHPGGGGGGGGGHGLRYWSKNFRNI